MGGCFDMSAGNGFDNPGDDDLAKRFQRSGGQAYFAELARRYGGPIERYCRRFVRDSMLAEDLSQETFLRAFTHIHQFQGGNFKAWLYRIAYTVCLNRLKPSGPEITALENLDRMSAQEDFVRELVSKAAVGAVLKELSAPQRICLKLLYIQGLSYREIVAETGYTEKDVKTHVQNGCRRFEILWKKRTGK
jgi:RNA polymerase sigma-70 factor (ECF subfamily)